MISNLLARLFLGLRSNRRHSARCRWSTPVAFESRTLLAGNVTAAIVGGNLQLTGDSSANEILISKTDVGTIVQGQNGTTINGGNAAFTAFAASLTTTGSILAKLEGGDDKVHLSSVTLDKTVAVFGGAGNDQVAVTDSTLKESLIFIAGVGNDSLYVEKSQITQNVSAILGTGDDLAAFRETGITKNLAVFGGAGADRVSLDQTDVDGWLLGVTSEGNDDIRIANNSEIARVHLRTGRGADLVQLVDATISSSFFSNLGAGSDNLAFDDDTSIATRLTVRGGTGHDAVDEGQATLPASKRLMSVDADEVAPEIITSRITSPTTGLIAAVEALRNSYANPASIVGAGVFRTSTQTIATNTSVDVEVNGSEGQVFEVDRDGDGFDDGTTTIDADGKSTITVNLANTSAAANNGLNTILVRRTSNGSPVGLTSTLTVQYTEELTAKIATTQGDITVELLGDEAPVTVQNFLNYLARYDGSVIHRSAHLSDGSDFIIQGGGFDLVPPLQAIATDAPITNEFDPDQSNLRGTFSMALPAGGPNLGTSQWFINVADNESLDAALHTVFGIVDDTGMEVADAIHALTSQNLIGPLDNQALGEVPLVGYTPFTVNLAGTVSVTTGTRFVTGVGTNFMTALKPNAAIQIGGVAYTVQTITSNTLLTLKENATTTVASGAAKANATPTDAQYVRINSVTIIPQLS